MATIRSRTFPGVYSSVIDRSQIQPATSRFRVGLIGVTTKGPFNTPTVVRSYKEFRSVFGKPLSTSYAVNSATPEGAGYFLADAVAILSSYTDQIAICRVGSTYSETGVSDAAVSGFVGGNKFVVSPATSSSGLVVGNFVRLQEALKTSTVNALVSVISNGTVTVNTSDASNPAMQAQYASASLSFSPTENAANKAESILKAYTYTLAAGVGAITGNKNEYSFVAASGASSIGVGDVYKITQSGLATTYEVRVKSIAGNTVYLEPASLTQFGYQALPLQANYTGGMLYKVTGSATCLQLNAISEGTWANGSSTSVGLYVKVRPGSTAGTKKFEVYVDSALVETLDNLSEDTTATPTAASAAINYADGLANSQYIALVAGGDASNGPVANTVDPWDANYDASGYSTLALKSMPAGEVNGGNTSGGSFLYGADGVSATESDFIGTVDTTTDSMTGVKAFRETDRVQVDVIAAPMDLSQLVGSVDSEVTNGMGLMQELRETAHQIKAIALVDVPPGINAREAIDWHNGAGLYKDRGRIDDYSIACFWNWWKGLGADNVLKFLPPTIGVLRCMGFTWNQDKPWYAAAGETRGLISEAIELEYQRVSEETKDAMYGEGNSVNPILKMRSAGGRRILVFGERTMQRLESKLTAIHSVILVNYCVNNLAELARRFVFDPNDQELLIAIRLAFTDFMEKVKNGRGVEEYLVIVDERNNNADTRNRREVNVDIQLIPVDTVERIFISATVNESGASLTSIS